MLTTCRVLTPTVSPFVLKLPMAELVGSLSVKVQKLQPLLVVLPAENDTQVSTYTSSITGSAPTRPVVVAPSGRIAAAPKVTYFRSSDSQLVIDATYSYMMRRSVR